jgi:hypothetical protein
VTKGAGEGGKDEQLTDEEDEVDDEDNTALDRNALKRYTEDELNEAIKLLQPYSDLLSSHNDRDFNKSRKGTRCISNFTI